MLLLLSALTAQAEPSADVACEPAYVARTLPALGATGVPLDARVVIDLEGDCGGPTFYELGLYGIDESGAEFLVESVEVPFVNINTLLVLTPSDELAPNTDHVVRIVPSDGWGEMTEISFTTGEGSVQGLGEGRPEVQRMSAETYDPRAALIDVTWSAEVKAAADPDGLSVLLALDPADNETIWEGAVPDVDQAYFNGWMSSSDPISELCVQFVQVDGAGAWSLPTESCAKIESYEEPKGELPWGCSGAAAPSSAALALFGLLTLRRRRAV
jgi:hypothetical protein